MGVKAQPVVQAGRRKSAAPLNFTLGTLQIFGSDFMKYSAFGVLITIWLTGCVVGKNVRYIDIGDTNQNDAAAQVLKASMIEPTMENGIAAMEKKEYVLARLIFEKVAEKGKPEAQMAVGSFYADGMGVKRSSEEALKWFRKAADQGYAPAQFFVGRMFAMGPSIQPNYIEAMKWLRLAADQKFGEAEFLIGYLHESGSGVTKDSSEAARWYEKAAEHGSVNGQLAYGAMYWRGDVVNRDFAKAMTWYRKAAANGSPDAYYRIGLMYDEANGIPRDPTEAYVWYSLAAEKNWRGAKPNKERVAKELSPAQLTDAESKVAARRKDPSTTKR